MELSHFWLCLSEISISRIFDEMMTKNKIRIIIITISVLVGLSASIPLMSDTSKPDIANQAVLDAWCEKAWYDMITQKEGRQTDARLIGNIMRGAC